MSPGAEVLAAQGGGHATGPGPEGPAGSAGSGRPGASEGSPGRTELARLRSADRRRAAVVAGALLAVLASLAVLALAVGAVALTPGEVVAALLGRDGSPRFIVMGLRLPRLALGAAVGAALGLAGALLQSVVRNPLASPDIVGMTGGASAAAVLVIAAGGVGAAVDGAALGGALAAAAAVFLLSGRGVGGGRFVVVGVAVAFLATGVLGYALSRASLTAARAAYFWLVGSVGTAPWSDVLRVGAVVAVAAGVLLLAHRELTALALDDDTARALGGHPVAARAGAIVVTSVLTAAAVAVAGPIAFVAFVSGPLARRLRGHGPALTTAALVGAVTVVGADLVAQHLVPGSLQPPAGLVTGALGAPVLLWMLVRTGRRSERAA